MVFLNGTIQYLICRGERLNLVEGDEREPFARSHCEFAERGFDGGFRPKIARAKTTRMPLYHSKFYTGEKKRQDEIVFNFNTMLIFVCNLENN